MAIRYGSFQLKRNVVLERARPRERTVQAVVAMILWGFADRWNDCLNALND
jgi:hypothetical protein